VAAFQQAHETTAGKPLPIGAKPFVDELLSGHDLASLEKLALVLPKLG